MYQLLRLTHSDSKSSDFWGFVGTETAKKLLKAPLAQTLLRPVTWPRHMRLEKQAETAVPIKCLNVLPLCHAC